MAKKSFVLATLVALCLLASPQILAAPLRQATSMQIIWWTVDTGGDSSGGGAFGVRGTAGQPDTGVHSGGNFRLTDGFWAGVVQISETTGAMTGVVFLDINHNGERDVGEQGIEGVMVELVPAGGGTGQAVTTAKDGSYSFENLTLGDYTVTVSLPVEYTPTTETVLQVTLDGPEVQIADVGAALTTGSMTGVVFLDINRNGEKDVGEQGIEGVMVELVPAGGGTGQAATTAEDGSYSFENLTLGDYTVTVSLPAEYTPTTETVLQVTLNVSQLELQVADIGAARLLFNPAISK